MVALTEESLNKLSKTDLVALAVNLQDYYFIFIKTLFIKFLFNLRLERKIYKNEMITAKDKKVIHTSRPRTSRLQASLRETSNPRNAKAPSRKCRKLAHLLMWI